MTAETAKIKSKLLALSASFDDLETQLEPLFSQTLPETIIALEPLQQAKLQTLLPYLVYDLIFIYLKTRGIDPKTHPVVHELDRIREYFEKINLAENPPAKRTEIDKAAATRFIKHAIAQAQWKKTAAEADDEDDNNVTSNNIQQAVSSSSHIPVKMTTKMTLRAAYEKEIKEQDTMETDEDEEGGLEVFDQPPTRTEGGENKQDAKGKGKETASPAIADEDPDIGRNKRRRPMIDPFAGYGDNVAPPNRPTTKKVKSSENSPRSHRPTSPKLDPKSLTVDTRTSLDCKQRSISEKRAKKKAKGPATSTSLK